jgi:uncharacterized protein YcaQ
MLVTRANLRSLLLARQGLLAEHGLSGAGGAAAWVAAHGFLLLDTDGRSIAPGHDLVLFNRLDSYQQGNLDSALYGSGLLFEHRLHLLGALPATSYRLIYDPERAARASQPGSVGALVLACLSAEGPCTLRELHAYLRRHAGCRPQAISQAVRALFISGAILVRQREGSQPAYDLAQRIIADPLPAPMPLKERLYALAQATLEILAPVSRATWLQVLAGIGARSGLGLSAMKREKSRLIDAILAEGTAVQIVVDAPHEVYILPAAWLEALSQPSQPSALRVCFLSPLDPLVWDGQRTRDLFGFDSRQQAYLPQVRERRFAPPVLPILYGQDLVGRLEVQMNWAEAQLIVQTIHLENQSSLEDSYFRAAFGTALQELAAWHGAQEIRPAGPLPPRLLP